MFKVVPIDAVTAYNTPSKCHYNKNGIYVVESLIPQSRKEVHLIYFVSGHNGDEFGQFPTLIKAILTAHRISSLSEIDRKIHVS